MACLGTIDVIEREMSVTVSDGITSLVLDELYPADLASDGTALAMMSESGDPLMKVNTVDGNVDGLIMVKDNHISVTGITEVTPVSTLLTALDVDTIDWLSGTQVSLAFNTTPDFSDVVAGDTITIASATNAINNGVFTIDVVNDATDVLIITNPLRVDATGDEATDSPATGAVTETRYMDVDTISWVSGTLVDLVYNLTPDLSGLVIGDRITVANATNASNDGVFTIVTITDGSDTIRITNPARTDATDDEATDSPATSTVQAPAARNVASTRDYCECTGLCYVD